MKVAVVNVNKSRINRSQEYYLYTIKSFLDERAGGQIETELVDIFMTDDTETSIHLLDNMNLDIVLFRIHYWNAAYVEKLVSKLDIRAMKGLWGHDSFSHPEDYLKGNFDFIIQDEPELSLYEIAALKKDGKDLSKAAGVVYKDEIRKTYVYGENRVLPELDLIPSPYVNGMVEINEDTAVFWEISRGCLFRCDFCVEFSHDNKLRYHSFNYLESELKIFAQKGISHIVLGCTIFNLSHQHFKKILDMVDMYLPDAFIEVQLRPDILTRQEIEEIAGKNLFLNFGLQTANQKVHENLMTSLNVENALSNIRYMANYPAISFGVDVIAGLPKMSFDDFLEDLETVFHLLPVSINVYRLSMYPGTRIYNRMREFDYSIEHTYPFLASGNPLITKREFEKAGEIGDGIDLLYNRGRLVSVITMLSKGLDMPCHEIVSRWNKWLKKQDEALLGSDPETIEYSELFKYIKDYFHYLFDRFQRKKLWPLAQDILNHNDFYTSSLKDPQPDVITYPYQLPGISSETVIGMNKSASIGKFSFNIEDVIDTGYIDMKKYSHEVDKENTFGLIYRMDGGVFTSTVSDEEGKFFTFLRKKGRVTVGEIAKKFKDIDAVELVSYWCEENVLFIDEDQ